MTSERPLFILIDDDPIHNAISSMTIKNVIANVEVVVFSDPKSGLDFLNEEFASHESDSVVLLLNLNMPFMSGWEFLEQFSGLSPEIQERIRVYLLSASIRQSDQAKAGDSKWVRGYLIKPLSVEGLMAL
jgi:response regulator RpfG family c-di-GMP phosphodiesterase